MSLFASRLNTPLEQEMIRRELERLLDAREVLDFDFPGRDFETLAPVAPATPSPAFDQPSLFEEAA